MTKNKEHSRKTKELWKDPIYKENVLRGRARSMKRRILKAQEDRKKVEK